MRRFGKGKNGQDHRDALELLPWYVNGTLEESELEGLALHLDGCDRCRAELAQQRSLAHALRASEEMAFSAERAFEQLRNRLNEDTERERLKREGSPYGLLDRLREGFRGLAVPARWAMAAQLAVIVALGAALVREERVPDQGQPAEFQTLTRPPALAAGEAPRLRVVFDATASEGDIRALLVQSGSRVVNGPSPFGVYTIEVADESGGDVLDALRSSSLVTFAELVSGNEDSRP